MASNSFDYPQSTSNDFGIFGMDMPDELAEEADELNAFRLPAPTPEPVLPKLSASSTQKPSQQPAYSNPPPEKPKKVQYTPYTIKDYRNLQPVEIKAGLRNRTDIPEYQAALALKQRREEYNEIVRQMARQEREMKASAVDPKTTAFYSPQRNTKPTRRQPAQNIRGSQQTTTAQKRRPVSGNPPLPRQPLKSLSPAHSASASPPRRPVERLQQLPPTQRQSQGQSAIQSTRKQQLEQQFRSRNPNPTNKQRATAPANITSSTVYTGSRRRAAGAAATAAQPAPKESEQMTDEQRRALFNFYEKQFIPVDFLTDDSARDTKTEQRSREGDPRKTPQGAGSRGETDSTAELGGVTPQNIRSAAAQVNSWDLPQMKQKHKAQQRQQRQIDANALLIRQSMEEMGLPESFFGPKPLPSAPSPSVLAPFSFQPHFKMNQNFSVPRGTVPNAALPVKTYLRSTRNEPRYTLNRQSSVRVMNARSQEAAEEDPTSSANKAIYTAAASPLAPSTQQLIAEDVLDAAVASLTVRHQRDAIDVALMLRRMAKQDAKRRQALSKLGERPERITSRTETPEGEAGTTSEGEGIQMGSGGVMASISEEDEADFGERTTGTKTTAATTTASSSPSASPASSTAAAPMASQPLRPGGLTSQDIAARLQQHSLSPPHMPAPASSLTTTGPADRSVVTTTMLSGLSGGGAVFGGIDGADPVQQLRNSPFFSPTPIPYP